MRVLAIVTTLALLAVTGAHATEEEGSVKRNLRPASIEDSQVPRASSYLAQEIKRLERVFMHPPKLALEAQWVVKKATTSDTWAPPK